VAVTDEDIPVVRHLAEELRTRARVPFAEVAFLPKSPGLYAIWAETLEAKVLLGLSDDGFDLPLYVGLARQPLPGRVGQYVDPTDAHYVPARWWIEYQLLVASHIAVPEAVLLGAPQLWMDGPLPLHQHHLDALTYWMQRHLSVSVVAMDSKTEAQRLEHSVIRLMEPVANRQGMAWALDVPGYYESRYTADAAERRFKWAAAFEALRLLAEVFNTASYAEALSASQRDMWFAFDADGLPESIVFQRQSNTNKAPLTLPLHPEQRRQACREAMDQWWGERYPELDDLIGRLGPEDWVPGVLCWLLVGMDESLIDPLKDLDSL